MAQFILSAQALEHNARILRDISQQSGARMLVALKACSTTAALRILSPYAEGCCASGLYEAKLAQQHMGKEIAVYSPAYQAEELSELLTFAHHIDFNSIPQWRRYREQALQAPRAKLGELRFGLRINPCYSTGHTPLYDPCIPGSRLGIPHDELCEEDLHGISGLHFHTLCEQGAQELHDTYRAFEQQFGDLLASPKISYLNLGGGHWITKPDYDRQLLIALIREIREKYQIDVYLEPGEAWFIHSGVLRARVLDIFTSLGYRHAILDISASAHMPDVLEMPYRPEVYSIQPSTQAAPAAPAAKTPTQAPQPALHFAGEQYQLAGEAQEKSHSYRLGAPTCLAGDILGDYSFDQELQLGDELLFDDMCHYTIVKTSHFNGVPHPDIVLHNNNGELKLLKRFQYEDFLNRLG